MTILYIFLWLITLAAPKNERTDFETCISCYANGWTHCLGEDFQYSMCCKENLESCTKGFKYCTTKLTQNIYRVLTCPMDSCPEGSVYVEHDSINKTKVSTRSFGYFEPASFCKIVFTAKSTLNGKMTVEINRAD